MPRLSGPARLAAVTAVLALAAACGGSGGSAPPSNASPSQRAAGPTGSPIAANGNLCGLLGTGDFSAAGVSGTHAANVNNSEPGSYSCVFSGDSGAAGGVEFDAFVSASIDDAKATYVAASEGITDQDTSVEQSLGVDQGAAMLNLPGGGGGSFGALVAQKGRFVFSLSLPSGNGAMAQLSALSKLVMQRATGLF